MMPLEVMENIVGVLPDDAIIVDPFMGSGTTGIACRKYEVDFIGIEIDEKYFRIAEQRINENEPINEPKIEPIKTEIFQYSLF